MGEIKEGRDSVPHRIRIRFSLILIAIGIVYGDIGTSPLYVMKAIVAGNGGIGQVNPEFIIGSLSLVIWTMTLLTTVQHVLIAMRADNHGEGGIFALYSLVKHCGKWLVFPTMLGGAAVLADGVLTPAVTVTNAVEGLRSIETVNRFLGPGQGHIVQITLCIILVLFLMQRSGTSKIGKIFGPVMLVWFGFLAVTGVTISMGYPAVFRAVNPVYAVRVLFSDYNKSGIMILGGVFLSTTGAEALYSDMGHVGKENIYISWPFVKIALILNYFGQGAWILQNTGNTALYGLDVNPFYMMLPEDMRPFAIVISALAAIIASQALITGSFTLVSEAILLDLMPHMEIRYPSDTVGQLYIPKVNFLLWILCTGVILYFRSGSRMEAAYGFAITVSMLMTTLLLTVYLVRVRHHAVFGILHFIVFGLIDLVFFVACLDKFTRGGYLTVILTLLIMAVMLVWYRGTQLEKKYRTRLRMRDYVDKLKALHDDESVPLLTSNLVYIDNESDPEFIDRDILYSILDKTPKRAQAYWFLNIQVQERPYVRTYKVETYGTNFIFRVHLYLGFKCGQQINVYLRNIVEDLQKSRELPIQNKHHSIYRNPTVGSFRFCVIYKSVPTRYSELTRQDETVLITKYAIRSMIGSRIRWMGLDTSSIITEYVPVVLMSRGNVPRIRRVYQEENSGLF